MRERFTRRKLLKAAVVFAAAACAPTVDQPKTTNPELPGVSDLDFPLSGDIYLLLGPHYEARQEGIRYAIDIYSPDKDSKVIAAKYGTVIFASAAMVGVDVGDGYSLEYVHVGNIKKRVGDKVHRGDVLGEMSMESPPGGTSDRLHLHFGIKRYGVPIEIDGFSIAGWIIRKGQNPGDGTMSKEDKYAIDNYTAVANPNLCGPSRESIQACGGINYIANPRPRRPTR